MAERTDDGEFLEVERYELREGPPYRFEANRREFVQVLGSGLMIAAAATRVSGQRGSGRRGGRNSQSSEKLTDRFHVSGDGRVTVFTGKVEVGQGSRTQISQAVAEEFRLPVDRIDVVMADTLLCPNDGGTAGSRTTPATIRARASVGCGCPRGADGFGGTTVADCRRPSEL